MNTETTQTQQTITPPLPPKSANQIAAISEVLELSKMDHFAKAGSASHDEYIVVEGVCRAYVLDYEGNEATLAFYSAGDVLAPNQVRTINGKSLYSIQALTTAKVMRFDSEEFASMMKTNSEIHRWAEGIYNTELKHKVEKELELITLPAKERLAKFRTKHPLLENLIPHQYIASYLGISPVSLSRLRALR